MNFKLYFLIFIINQTFQFVISIKCLIDKFNFTGLFRTSVFLLNEKLYQHLYKVFFKYDITNEILNILKQSC